MKRLLLLVLPVLLVMGLHAVDFDISGENRVRAAIYNSPTEIDGGHIDNRFNIYFDSQFNRNLSFRVAAEIGNVVWGNGGGAISTGADIHFNELNFNYQIDAIDANIIVGQQYWMDRMGLVMDDYFSGILLQKRFGANLNTEFAWMKAMENNRYAKDDYDVFMAHAVIDSDSPVGIYAFFGKNDFSDYDNLSIMPYISMEMGTASLDATAFLDMQMGTSTELGFGGALKAKIDMDAFELGMDVLVATENGLTTVSPWYQNGLYIYGIGKHHDGLNLYWNTPYEANSDLFASLVGSLKAPLNDKMSLFGAAGYLIDLGMELNAGFEYQLIPDLLNLSAYGAYGIHENETNNYMIGTSVKIDF